MSSMVLLNATQIRPSDSWLASSLMLSDKIATISVPFRKVPDGLSKLKAADLWEPASIGEINPFQADAIVSQAEVLTQASNTEKPQQVTNRSLTADYILKKKIPESLHDRLLDSELTDGEYNAKGEFIYTGSPVFIDTVLNLVGRVIANEHRDENWCLAINSQDEARVNLKTFPKNAMDTEITEPIHMNQESMSIQIGLPTPIFSEKITLAEVIELRQKNVTAFINFRNAAEQLTTRDLDTDSEEYFEKYVDAVRKLSGQAQGRWSRIKLETKYLVRPINPAGTFKAFKNVRDPAAALAAAGASLTAISAGQDIFAADTAAITAIGITAAAFVVKVRQDSPVCWLKQLMV